MNRYPHIRSQIRDGDVFMVQGTGIVSWTIRALTGQSTSHIGLLIWYDSELFIVEMKEFKGYNMMPASLWINDHINSRQIWWGKAPEKIRGKVGIKESAMSYRGSTYGYKSLLKILWGQITNKKINIKKLVCSTFIQRVWMMMGMKFTRATNPGDYMSLCDDVYPLLSMEVLMYD